MSRNLQNLCDRSIRTIFVFGCFGWMKGNIGRSESWNSKPIPSDLLPHLKNGREFLDWLGFKLGFKEYKDWYNISVEVLQNYEGSHFLSTLGNSSPFRLLETLYPEHEWLPWKMVRSPNEFWNSKEHAKRFIESLADQLAIKKPEDWYRTSLGQISRITSLTPFNRRGMYWLLSNAYPDHSWEMEKCDGEVPSRILEDGDVHGTVYPQDKWFPWKLNPIPKNYWESKSNQKLFVEWLQKELHIQNLEDWYRVSSQQISRIARSSPFKKFGFFQILQNVYPSHHWDITKLKERKPVKASQRILLEIMKEIFPHSEIHEDYLHNELKFSSGRNMQLDIFLPSESLALEYQGEHHYYDLYVFGEPNWRHAERDQEKRIACAEKGINLIEIPYWWDFTKESLMATIHDHRQELVPEAKGKSIPKDPPEGFRKGKKS